MEHSIFKNKVLTSISAVEIGDICFFLRIMSWENIVKQNSFKVGEEIGFIFDNYNTVILGRVYPSLLIKKNVLYGKLFILF